MAAPTASAAPPAGDGEASPMQRLSSLRRVRALVITAILTLGSAGTVLVLLGQGLSFAPLHLPLQPLLGGVILTTVLLWVALALLQLRRVGLRVQAGQGSRMSLGAEELRRTSFLLVAVVALLAVSLSLHPALGSPSWLEQQLVQDIDQCPHNVCLVTPGGGSFDASFPGNDPFDASTVHLATHVKEGPALEVFLGTAEAYTQIDSLNRSEVINNALARSSGSVMVYDYDGATLGSGDYVARMYDHGNESSKVEVRVTHRLSVSLLASVTGQLTVLTLVGMGWWWTLRTMARGPRVRSTAATGGGSKSKVAGLDEGGAEAAPASLYESPQAATAAGTAAPAPSPRTRPRPAPPPRPQEVSINRSTRTSQTQAAGRRTRIRCPSCAQTFAIAVQPRPLDIDCPHCGHHGTVG